MTIGDDHRRWHLLLFLWSPLWSYVVLWGPMWSCVTLCVVMFWLIVFTTCQAYLIRLTIGRRDTKSFLSLSLSMMTLATTSGSFNSNRNLSHLFRGGMTNYRHQAFYLKWMLPVCSGSVDKWIALDIILIMVSNPYRGLTLSINL